jgi:ABC-type amino acid transport substrate-binding protein
MKKISLKKLLILTVVFVMPIFATNNGTKDAQDTIIVGTKSAPPFAMRNKQGEWEGISIELWKEIAKDLNLKYKFKEQNLTAMLNGVEEGSSNVAIAAITVTLDREKRFDFSHCYYTTGLTIATIKHNQNGWVTLIKAFFSYEMLTIITYLATLLFIVGTITWLVERKKNKENFHNDPIKGIASGIWWAAVTMTTVGYGDMTPKTLVGRLIALFWMFSSLLLVSSIIAGVTSALTMANLKEHKVTTD